MTMPRPLLRYWEGKGRAKIRPGTPGAFDRCVRIFSGFGVKDPQGTCANLIHEQSGKWPGQERGRGRRAALTAAIEHTGAMVALVPAEQDAQRIAVPGGEQAQDLHITLAYLGEAAGLDEMDREDILDEMSDLAAMIGPVVGTAFGVAMFNPADNPAIVLTMGGEAVEFLHEAVENMIGDYLPERGHAPYAAHLTVAYSNSHELMAAVQDRMGPWVFDRIRVAFGGEQFDLPLGAQEAVTASVNATTWEKLPIAERETKFSVDDALARIKEWAGGDASRYATAFLWKSSQGDPARADSYRLPVGDIVDGKLTLIPRAVFSAAVILSGGHGELEGVVGDDERKKLKGVLSDIYDKLREVYGDPRVVAPWERGGNEREDVTASITASVNRSGWDAMPVADVAGDWDSGQAKARVWSWAEGDFGKYRKAFLWWDASAPELKGSYKLPIADVVDGELTIVPRAVNAVASVLGGGRGGVDIPEADATAISSIVTRLQKRWQSMTAAAPLNPPREWFDDPKLPGPTPLVVTADGRVMGHLAAWGVCHSGITGQCVMAPRTATGYRYFANGSVLTADGSQVRVGRITLGTGHADTRLGWMPAAEHYDNTGTAVAVVAAGEDQYGIWVAGATVPGVPDEKVAELRRSPLSGDWRRVGPGLELVAALAVNTPGFPIVASVDGGGVDTIVAAGVLTADGELFAAVDTAKRLADIDTRFATIRARARLDRLASREKG